MGISNQIQASFEGSSLIRKMFEEGDRRRQLYGEENVFDLSIGNPVFEPPPEVKQALLSLIQSDARGTHRYMPNSGYPETRQYVAAMLNRETDPLMLVGHRPFMDRLAGLLVAGSQDRVVMRFRKGGIVCLDRDPKRWTWTVCWMVTPDLIP